jgi:hypothetical protein
MCSSGGEVASTDEALQKSQAAMTNTLNADYSLTFAEQQSVAKDMIARADNLMANPLGFTAPELATATTAINENTATAAKQAIGAAGAFAASHGGADVGNGSIGQIAGEIGSAAQQSKAQQLSTLSNANEAQKRSSFYAGLSELNNAGNDLGGVGSTALGGSAGAASTSTGAGSGALAAQNQTWGDISGILGGVAGLGEAGASAYKTYTQNQ